MNLLIRATLPALVLAAQAVAAPLVAPRSQAPAVVLVALAVAALARVPVPAKAQVLAQALYPAQVHPVQSKYL